MFLYGHFFCDGCLYFKKTTFSGSCGLGLTGLVFGCRSKLNNQGEKFSVYRLVCKGFAQMDECALHELGRFRHKIFIERLKWGFERVQKIPGVELDEFDLSETMYVIAHDFVGSIVGCTRLLPTTRPFLLGDVFPELCDEVVPRNPSTWEISRAAAIDIGAENLGVELFEFSIRYASSRGARTVVAVTTCSLERYCRVRGIKCNRLGPVVNYGREKLVALEFSTIGF